MDKPLHECWCVFFTKLKIYESKVEIGNFFGLFNKIIPMARVASVGKGMTGIEFETSGGGKIKIQPWRYKNRAKAMDTILALLKNTSK